MSSFVIAKTHLDVSSARERKYLYKEYDETVKGICEEEGKWKVLSTHRLEGSIPNAYTTLRDL